MLVCESGIRLDSAFFVFLCREEMRKFVKNLVMSVFSRLFWLLLPLLLPQLLFSQDKKDFGFKFYGQVRADLFYNSRSNSETVDGLFYMYPKDHSYDADGNDLNAKPDGSLYTMYSRLGVDIAGPKIGKGITTSAKVEIDFRGGGTNYYMIRLRQAYFNLGFGKSSLLVGQTWHPFYGDVTPDILNLNMGAPFQPFSRAPQIRYMYVNRNFQLKATALWQSQYLSVGPKSDNVGETATQKSQNFIKKSCVPEFYLGVDYKKEGLLMGVGGHVSSITPRTRSVAEDGKTYHVSERVTGLSGEAHVKYTRENWLFSAKSVLGTNLTQTSTVGGYGITAISATTGEQTYAPLRVSSTWVNVAYGKVWRPALFFGYLKNLGSSEDLLDMGDGRNVLYGRIGTGTDLDQLLTGSAELTYNCPNWKLGVEYSLCNAWYGNTFTPKAKAIETESVMNHRVVLTALFQF